MIQDTEPTNVSFYLATYENEFSEVVAVFVDDKYYSETSIGYGGITKEDVENTFESYVHIGQHTVVSKSFLKQYCKKITEKKQYQELFNELKSLGYNLNVV